MNGPARILVVALAWALPLLASAYTPTATPVAEGVYAIIGPTDGRTPENQALNNNLGFVVTPEGVVLMDSGASAQGAAAVEAAVGEVTDQPVRWVLNTGSQDHRWLGNDYFRARGARIIALEGTVATQKRFAQQHLERLRGILGEALDGTRPAHAEPPLPGERASLNLGGVPFELIFPGDAHFPGDALVWLPRQGVLFSGDVIYVDRMLGVHPWSDVVSWREAFRNAMALEPAVIVPGHGQVCDAAQARRETGEYLDWLVTEVGAAVADWEPMGEAVERLSEAPAFSHLEHYDSWHRTNLNRTYLQLEGGGP